MFSNPFNLGILILAVILLVFFCIALRGYVAALRQFESVEESAVNVSPEGTVTDTKQVRTDFSMKKNLIERCRVPDMIHAAVVQFIPLFPLLGIFGTVWGLYLSLSATQGTDMMEAFAEAGTIESLRFAFTSTITGLVAAIVLKALDALLAAPLMEDIDSRLELFDAMIELSEREEGKGAS